MMNDWSDYFFRSLLYLNFFISLLDLFIYLQLWPKYVFRINWGNQLTTLKWTFCKPKSLYNEDSFKSLLYLFY